MLDTVDKFIEEGDMPKQRLDPEKPVGKQLVWFVALWLLGVTGTALLVLPFHLLISAAMHH
jgi:hypothetical protein